jgi:hypothetical protein
VTFLHLELNLRILNYGSSTALPFTKKRENISFGNYPDISLADAREKRSNARKLLAKDIARKPIKNKLPKARKRC